MTAISGDDAKYCDAVRLDSFATVNLGPLVSADESTGVVHWKDKVTAEAKQATLGAQAIRIVRKPAYGRG